LGKLNLSLFFDARIDDHWRAEIEAIAKYTRRKRRIAPIRLMTRNWIFNLQMERGKKRLAMLD
jgi:hypothetical protein